MTHLDTKVIENYDGTVNHLIFDYHDADSRKLIVLIICNSVLVLEINDDNKLEQKSYKKNLHLGKK